ncbi:hypothetical protein KOR42_12950 [Thalassoglobus neptunius]|uniref:Uncharacterized protein n=1 Tax=Thalassoglobus neptunius TaxID=1938619 RepID=A0A5C5X475_9PLAN|nr:hypothetical protein KOR42_12950 [Thalassoglobus neptunius]
MFRCELCQAVVPAGVRTSRVILVTRSKTYVERGRQPMERGGPRGRGRSSGGKSKFDKGGEGSEIVREAAVCPKCAAQHEQDEEIKQQQLINSSPETGESDSES